MLEYAETASATPAVVSDSLVGRLQRFFSDDEMVELAAWVALENLRPRFTPRSGFAARVSLIAARHAPSPIAPEVGGSETFPGLQPTLFGVAYRMLGSATDAGDVLQDADLPWQGSADGEVESPRSFLTTVVVRLCIDQLRTGRVRREAYVGPWLPEPLATKDDDPALVAELADTLSLAFLVLLEELSPSSGPRSSCARSLPTATASWPRCWAGAKGLAGSWHSGAAARSRTAGAASMPTATKVSGSPPGS